MAGHPKHMLQNTLEEILSSDLTRIGELAGKAAMDAQRAMLQPFGGAMPAAVRQGLDASNAGAGDRAVTISAGELVYLDGGVNPLTSDDSDLQLGVLEASSAFNLDPNASGNPRIDLIYATIADADTDSSTRNELTLPGRTVAPAALDKTRRGVLTIAVVVGTPAATPAFPSTPAGATALWYAYVPNGATAILDDHFMDARVYWSIAAQLRLTSVVSGLRPRVGTTDADVSFCRGIALVEGALGTLTADSEFAVNDVLQDGESIAADREIDFYVVAKGSGVPISKTAPDGIGFVGTIDGASSPPDDDASSSGSLLFAPLAFAAANQIGKSVCRFATSKVAYVGSLHTGSGASLSPAVELNGAPKLERDGSSFLHAADAHSGRFPSRTGWLRRGVFEWVSVSQVRIRGAAGVVGGTPFSLSTLTFDLTGDRVSGDALTPETWYYVYLRKRYSNAAGATPFKAPCRELVPKISLEPPAIDGSKPTPETGFDSSEYLYVGSIYNDAGLPPQIKRFWRNGGVYKWGTAQVAHSAADLSIYPTMSTITVLAPPTARSAIVSLYALIVTNTGPLVLVNVYLRSGTSSGENHSFWTWATSNLAASETFGPTGEIHVPIDTLNPFFEASRSVAGGTITSFAATILCHGYVESPDDCAA